MELNRNLADFSTRSTTDTLGLGGDSSEAAEAKAVFLHLCQAQHDLENYMYQTHRPTKI
jgi:hypothetical protein